jgi:hypothetical protein
MINTITSFSHIHESFHNCLFGQYLPDRTVLKEDLLGPSEGKNVNLLKRHGIICMRETKYSSKHSYFWQFSQMKVSRWFQPPASLTSRKGLTTPTEQKIGLDPRPAWTRQWRGIETWSSNSWMNLWSSSLVYLLPLKSKNSTCHFASTFFLFSK